MNEDVSIKEWEGAKKEKEEGAQTNYRKSDNGIGHKK